MGREIYEHEPVFRDALDTCARHLRDRLGIDLIAAIYPPDEEKDAAAERLNQTWLTQPALFAMEYALAQWWMSQGIQPAAMVGHSIGEYVAACLAGVFSLEDALTVVAARGRLIYDLPAGSMLSVPLAPREVKLTGSLSLAAINNPSMSVISGPTAEIDALEESLTKQGVACRKLFTSHAFHSSMMEPMLGAFEEKLRGITMNTLRVPYLSNVSGTWIKAEEATDPAYWARHIRSTVRFSDNLAELLKKAETVLVECGPGNVLTTLARQQGGAGARAYQTLPHPRENTPALRCALQTLGQLWTLGVEVDWAKMHAPGSVRRVSLPTYPFEHQRFWIGPDRAHSDEVSRALPKEGLWFYRRVWKPAPLAIGEMANGPWLIFRDELGLGERVARTLRAAGKRVATVDAGSKYSASGDVFTVRPAVREDYDALTRDLAQAGQTPAKIVHLWPVMRRAAEPALEEALDRCFYSPLFLAQALAARDAAGLEIALVSNGLQQVTDEATRLPERAVLLGPARLLHKELPEFSCKAVDVDFEGGDAGDTAARLIEEMAGGSGHSTVAYRRGQRFVESLGEFSLTAAPEQHRLKQGGVYMITGGLGGLGLVVAEHLATEFKARLVLVSRSEAVPEAEWEEAARDLKRTEPERARYRKLIEIRAQAGGLLIVQGDVTQVEQVRSAVATAQQRFGGIDGVMHAAGVLDDGPLMLKTRQSAQSVLEPKVAGALALDEAMRDLPLKCFVLFSSISSILPPAGQVDYAAANAFLDAFAINRKGPMIAINWGLWPENGMGKRFVSPHPWLEERLLNTPNEVVFSTRVSLERHWAFSEHRTRNGVGVLPGTAHMEMVAGAFSRVSSHSAIEFQNVNFLAPILLEGDQTKEVRVQLRRDTDESRRGNGAFRFSIFSRNGGWREHSTGLVSGCSARAAGADLAAIAGRCPREIVFDDAHRTRQELELKFGPRWRSLRKLRVGQGEALAEIALDDRFAADLSGCGSTRRCSTWPRARRFI